MAASPAEPTPTPRWAWVALGAFAVGGLVLRVFPLLRASGPLGVPIDYDEGVYFSSAALMVRGVLPYRDFVFVHPPGLLYLLGLLSSLGGDLAVGFEVSRFLAALVGAANVALVGAVVLRRSWFGGLVAAALYATYPEVVTVERGPFLEPVLNLACLAMALAWLSPRGKGSRAALVAGVLCGVALAVKVWGGVWLVAALLSLPAGRRAAEALQVLAGAAAGALLLVAPPALVAPGAFLEQTLLFHARRPPDGDVERLARLQAMLGWPHLAAAALSLVAVAAVGAGLRRGAPRASRDAQFFAVVAAVTLGGFLASSAYWSQYNAHLAPSQCALAGFGAACVAQWAARRLRARRPPRPGVEHGEAAPASSPRRSGAWTGAPSAAPHQVVTGRPQPVDGQARVDGAADELRQSGAGTFFLGPAFGVAVAVALAVPALARSLKEGRGRSPEQLALASALRAAVPADACLFTLEPAWGLLGGRLPAHQAGAPVIVDSYGALLVEATRTGRFPTAQAAFQSPASQASLRARLEACRYVVPGPRAGFELSAQTRAWFEAHYTPLGAPDTGALDVWQRREADQIH